MPILFSLSQTDSFLKTELLFSTLTCLYQKVKKREMLVLIIYVYSINATICCASKYIIFFLLFLGKTNWSMYEIRQQCFISIWKWNMLSPRKNRKKLWIWRYDYKLLYIQSFQIMLYWFRSDFINISSHCFPFFLSSRLHFWK